MESAKGGMRANFYIDGFNIYYRIREYHQKTGRNFRWLNYRSLCESILRAGDVLGDVYFFTAVCEKRFGEESPEERNRRVERHWRLLNALEGAGVRIVEGYFGDRDAKSDFESRPKEKQTDVAIAARMVADAAQKRCEKIFLFSGDNDFVPAIRAVKCVSDGGISPILMTPPFETGVVERVGIKRLEKEASAVNISFDDLCGHSFPKETPSARDGILIRMPSEYEMF